MSYISSPVAVVISSPPPVLCVALLSASQMAGDGSDGSSGVTEGGVLIRVWEGSYPSHVMALTLAVRTGLSCRSVNGLTARAVAGEMALLDPVGVPTDAGAIFPAMVLSSLLEVDSGADLATTTGDQLGSGSQYRNPNNPGATAPPVVMASSSSSPDEAIVGPTNLLLLDVF